MLVQRTRDELLAGARLARDQHRHARPGQPADGAEHFLHRGRLPDQRRDVLGGIGWLFRFMAVAARGAVHELHGLVDVERLRQVLERTALVGGNGVVEIGVRGNDDDR